MHWLYALHVQAHVAHVMLYERTLIYLKQRVEIA